MLRKSLTVAVAGAMLALGTLLVGVRSITAQTAPFDGQTIFRFDAFGDEQLWTDKLRHARSHPGGGRPDDGARRGTQSRRVRAAGRFSLDRTASPIPRRRSSSSVSTQLSVLLERSATAR